MLNGRGQIAKFVPDFFDLSFILLRGFSKREEVSEIIEKFFPHDQAAFISASIIRVWALSFSISAWSLSISLNKRRIVLSHCLIAASIRPASSAVNFMS